MNSNTSATKNARIRYLYIGIFVLLLCGTTFAFSNNPYVLVRQITSTTISGKITINTALYGKCAGPDYHSMQIATAEYGIIRATFTNEELNVPVAEARSLEGQNIRILLRKSLYNSLRRSPVREYNHLGRTILKENSYKTIEIAGKQIASVPKHLRTKKC